jgi:hypothetical protein
MKPIEIDIFFNPKGNTLVDLDIDIPLKECEINSMKFYNIDAVGRYWENDDPDVEYGTIIVSGMNLVTPFSHEELIKIVDKQYGN